ncbi:MAG TPA: pre-peptidase C-terminal domain-containing protein [Allosphingosinicella sp.]|nr:pre-peptidase C-terminal domain-containing protein [Allosphingosinicella sp.]
MPERASTHPLDLNDPGAWLAHAACLKRGGGFVGASFDSEPACASPVARVEKTPWATPPRLASGQTADGPALSIAPGGSASGVIGSSGDIDYFNIGLVAGRTYMVSLRGTGITPLLDPMLSLSNATATVATDDDGGQGAFSLLTFTASTTGTYQIAAGAYPESGLTGDYRLDVRQMGGDSVSASFGSAQRIVPGETAFGFLEASGDVDMFAVSLTAGTFYSIEAAGGADYNSDPAAVPRGELDTRIAIFDAAGREVAFNDDLSYPEDVSSGLSFAPAASGTYYIQVDAYRRQTGGFTLNVDEVDFSRLDPLDSIDWGTQLPSKDVTVYFAARGQTYDGVTSLGWTPYQIGRAMAAFQTWADVTDLNFTVTSEPNGATFKLVTTESNEFLGYFNPPGTPGAGVGVFAVNGDGWDDAGGLEQGGFGWITLVHEFGHGLGLAHPHDDGGTSDVMAAVTAPYGSYGVFDLNQGVYTTMSYNDGWQRHPDAAGGGATASPLTYGYQGGPGAFDIALVQQKYGADLERNGGDTVYVLPSVNAPGTFWTTIWDTGGVDTIAHNGSASALIDLTAATLDYSPTGAGVISHADGIFGGFAIANQVLVENAAGGSGADILIGNAAANRLDGGAGADTMIGGLGDDMYVIDEAGDIVKEVAGAGADGVQSFVSYALAPEVENLTLLGDLAINGGGNSLANMLTGNAAANSMSGAEGNDRLDGGAGGDTLIGGAGDDVYVVDSGGDRTQEAAGAGAGIDLVLSSVSHRLMAQVENLTLAGTGSISGTGNELVNILTGNAAANLLNGAAGADLMRGGAGNDTYIIDQAGDAASEVAAADGLDRAQSSVSFTLGDFVENLALTGPAAIDGTGNGLANAISGNAAANLLDGAAGADTMRGGDGDDVYIVDAAGDAAIETSAAGGVDRVQSGVGHTLRAYVENLILTGTSAINGTGNGLANQVTGNEAANQLRGALGDDLVDGGGGRDRLFGGGGSDSLEGGADRDYFCFDAAPDALNNVDAILDFSAADDALMLQCSSFSGIMAGVLGADSFTAGASAADAEDRIIHDAASGNLFYDADGIGGVDQILFATVDPGLALTHADFIGY